MTKAQQYIDSLLTDIPAWELKSIEHRNMFDEIKERLAISENPQADLAALYQVNGLSDFALSLLWIMEKVDADPALSDPSGDEKNMIFVKFKKAVGEESAPSFLDSIESAAAPEVLPVQEPQTESPFSGFSFDAPAPEPSADTAVPAAAGAVTPEQERNFANLLEKFLEAVQSAADDRMPLMESVKTECRTLLAASSVPEFHDFCRFLLELLEYASANGFVDDIRVMNIVSNIQDPLLQWVDKSAEDRKGLLDPALEILRDFKSMFE